MKNYTPPQLTDYGDIAELTGIFGSSEIPDVSIGPGGAVINTGHGSIDQCASADLTDCTINGGG